MAHKLHLSNFVKYSKIWIISISKWKLDKICFANFVYCSDSFKRNFKKRGSRIRNPFYLNLFVMKKEKLPMFFYKLATNLQVFFKTKKGPPKWRSLSRT